MEYTFDASKPSGHRIVSIDVGGKPLDMQREYKLVTRYYMVQGGDGFSSLRIKEHGGTAESIVDEENGALVSMLLRQYFMSLKILGRWKNWSSDLGHHWGGVQEDLHQSHPIREPVNPDDTKVINELSNSKPDNQSVGEDVPGLVGEALRGSSAPKREERAENAGSQAHLSDSEDDESDLPAVPTETSNRERELIVMRKVVRKWWRLAGMKGHPAMCDEQGDEFGVHWTRGVR